MSEQPASEHPVTDTSAPAQSSQEQGERISIQPEPVSLQDTKAPSPMGQSIAAQAGIAKSAIGESQPSETAASTDEEHPSLVGRFSPAGLIRTFFGIPDDPHQTSAFFRLSRAFCYLWTASAFSLKCYGAENIPRTGGVLLVSNHQSYLDPILLAVRLRRPVSFMARSTLFRNPAFEALIRTLYAFPVRRGEGDIGAMRQAISLLKAGHVLNVFPEGTRSTDGNLLPIASGIGLIIKRANVPVVPVYVNGSFRAWSRHSKLPRSTPVQVIYGKPADLSQLKGKTLTDWISRQFHDLRDQVQALHPQP